MNSLDNSFQLLILHSSQMTLSWNTWKPLSGKAETAIAEFSYCGKLYAEALQTLERKFGQPQVVVESHLEKLWRQLLVNMHNS